MARNKKIWLILIAAILGILIAVAAMAGRNLYGRLTNSFEAVTYKPPSVIHTPGAGEQNRMAGNEIAEALRAAGLSERGVIDSVGVREHLRRYQTDEVDAQTLLDYAANLEKLNHLTEGYGARIPTDFWDGLSAQQIEEGEDVYTQVARFAAPGTAPYLKLMARAWERFLAFKSGEASGEDTALDAALDILLMQEDYVKEVYEDLPAEDDEEGMKAIANAKIIVWQSLIAGTSRINPLTGQPLFSHGDYGRNSVAEMWRYRMKKHLGISEIWGVTGFDWQFVGTTENANQVEHMSITSFLQLVLGEPIEALNAIEDKKVLLNGADPAEAAADKALNQAVHDTLLPNYIHDLPGAVAQLRATLKGQ